MIKLRYERRRAAGRLPRFLVWDTFLDKAFSPYEYRSLHKCNKACDKLNGQSNREAKAYRFAKTGTYHG